MANEDVTGAFENRKYSCIAISDGVSTCARSRKGAEIAVATVIRLFRKCGDFLFGLTNQQISKTIFDEIQYELNALAQTEGSDMEDYSATIAFAAVQKRTGEMILFSLGDSAVVTDNDYKLYIASRPHKHRSGTYTTTTRDGYTTAYISRQSSSSVREICLLTDGAWDIAEAMYSGARPELPWDTLLRTAIDQSSNDDDSSFVSLRLA